MYRAALLFLFLLIVAQSKAQQPVSGAAGHVRKIFLAMGKEDLSILSVLFPPPAAVYDYRLKNRLHEDTIHHPQKALHLMADRITLYGQVRAYFELQEFEERNNFRFRDIQVDSVVTIPVGDAEAGPGALVEYELYIFATDAKRNVRYVIAADDALLYRNAWYGIDLNKTYDAADFPGIAALQAEQPTQDHVPPLAPPHD